MLGVDYELTQFRPVFSASGMKDAAAELLGHREALKCRLGGGGTDPGHPGELAPVSDAVEGATLLPGDDINSAGSNPPGVAVNNKEQEKQQQQQQNPTQSSSQQSQKQKRHRTRFTPAQLNELERSFAKTPIRTSSCARSSRSGSAWRNHACRWVRWWPIISTGLDCFVRIIMVKSTLTLY